MTLFKTFVIMFMTLSCASSYNSIVVETPNPSSGILPAEITSLTLMNRSITDEFQNFQKDSLQRYFYSQGFNVSSVVLDSLASDTLLMVLGELLYSSGRYDVVIPENRFFYRDLKYNKVPDELEWDEARNLCEEFNTDALLVLERYYNKVDTKYEVHPASVDFYKHVSASIDSKYDMILRVYYPANEKVTRLLTVTDTISWLDADLSTKELFARLPSIKDCLIETGIKGALDFDSQLSPSWSKEYRGYFAVDKEKDKAVASWVSDNNWEAVSDYWMRFTDSPDKATRSKAQHNMALASEMLGLIDESLEWARKSTETQYHEQTRKYIAVLNRRKEVLQKLESSPINY